MSENKIQISMTLFSSLKQLAASRYGSRKFIFAFVTQILNTVLIAFDTISDGTYASVTIAIVGAYLAANVTQKHIEK